MAAARCGQGIEERPPPALTIIRRTATARPAMYAVLAAAIIGSLFWSPADRTHHGDRWLASVGQSLHHRGDAGHPGLVTLEYRPDRPALLVGPRSDLKPVLGLGVSPDQTRYLYAGCPWVPAGRDAARVAVVSPPPAEPPSGCAPTADPRRVAAGCQPGARSGR
ncbi:hypothetical protein CATMQ487_46630 [Sphaerotilus microaerophilus]|uniref:Uncharacterized protein n=1 Tax=Sphaerotilus microaerophilus TaxID=2914710 RepID=A0ABM7YSS7_9BURK|nr:hypothetical protein CATMQ487_46630 [Sphaerotilus sp. FB-5]